MSRSEQKVADFEEVTAPTRSQDEAGLYPPPPGCQTGCRKQHHRSSFETTATYLQLIADTIPDKPILLLWDGATWHGGPAVAAFLEQNPRFTVIRFPPGSPDLNPQEHVWKLTREQVSHNHVQKSLHQLAMTLRLI